MTPDGADYVTTRVRIRQSPLSDAPDVPVGTRGHVEDDLRDVDGVVLVDFGEPYDTVVCEETELR